MSLKEVAIGLGVLSFVGITLGNFNFEEKIYTGGEYYYGDNQTVLNYKLQYETIYNKNPSDYEYAVSPPDFNKIPSQRLNDETVYVGSLGRVSFFTKMSGLSEADYIKIKDKYSHTFSFENEQAVLSPSDLKVTYIAPNTESGIIPSFSSYFSGNGVIVILEGRKSLYLGNDSIMNEYQIRIKLSNLSKTWQSIGHTVSCKEKSTERELFYTDFISENDYLFNPAVQVAVTGNTGSIAEAKGKTSYVTVTLEKRKTDSAPWSSMTFAEFYGIK